MTNAYTPVTLADEGVQPRRLRRLLFAAIWIVPALLATTQMSLVGDESGSPYDFVTALRWQGSAWMLWAIWAQLILWLVDRVRLDHTPLRVWLVIHAAGTAIVCIANVLAMAALEFAFSRMLRNSTYPDAVELVIANHLDVQVVLYWAVLGSAYMVEFGRRYRERDRTVTALERQLGRTQLEALRMQLNPHFLFNALNSVAELMEDDVKEAQRMLIRVSDLLRLSLRSAMQSLLPLWQEIELVELYLRIARVRYGAGLEVDINVDPSTVDLPIPSFLLQPLVENALKHGLAPGRPDQRLTVSVARQGGMLEILVEDNGRGLDGLLTTSGRFLAVPSVDGLGIGLTNTRSRLAMLYGDRYAFRMSNLPSGGCRVELRLPIESNG